MRIAAIVGDFPVINEETCEYIRKVREQMNADYLLAIISGNFLQTGVPAAENKYARAKYLTDAGADLVVELPVFSAVNSRDTFAFSSMAMVERLACVDELWLSARITNQEQENFLREIAMYLFMELPDFQKGVKALKGKGINQFEAQARMAEIRYPGAAGFLMNEENGWAAEYLKASKKMYSRVKTLLLPGKNHTGEGEPLPESGILKTDWEHKMAELLYAGYLEQEPSAARAWLDDTFGGTQYRTELLSELLHKGKKTDSTFSEIAQLLVTETFTLMDARRFLLRLLLRMRKVDNSVCGLYCYAPYIRILAAGPEREQLIDRIRIKAGSPVLDCRSSEAKLPGEASGLEECRRHLAELDLRADSLYHRLI